MHPEEPSKEKKKYGKYDEWEIENCADTLLKAEEIKNDPEKMKYVSKILSKKKKAINSIADLKARAQEVGEEEEKES